MTICIPRHYRQERCRFECEIITPMFLGNADQEAELRAAPFKGLLRYWWRVTQGNRLSSEELYKKESELFGSPDEEGGGKSGVTLRVESVGAIKISKDNFQNPGDINHPEVTGTTTKPLNYLAGMGLIKNGVLHSYLKPGCRFALEISYPSSAQKEMQATLTLFKAFAAIGSRSRNGWGSWQMPLANPTNIAASLTTLDEALDHNLDYPHCLGKDTKGPLLWKTRQSAQKWEDCMKDLADAYVGMRARPVDDLGKIAITNGQRTDRHLLGYPLTNHNVALPSWDKQGRHASGLRLLVRKDGNGQYQGYILHLPHLFSKTMWPGDVDRQKKIWKQVHAKLDKLMLRAKLEELI